MQVQGIEPEPPGLQAAILATILQSLPFPENANIDDLKFLVSNFQISTR